MRGLILTRESCPSPEPHPRRTRRDSRPCRRVYHRHCFDIAQRFLGRYFDIYLRMGGKLIRTRHLDRTNHPTGLWIAQQLREPFPFESAPRFLRRQHTERNRWHGEEFHRRNRFPMISEEGEPTFGRVSALVSSKGRSFSRRAQPSMRSTPCICGAPQFGFSVTMWKINSRTSFGVRLLPICLRTLAINRQYIREPVRCQRTTVSGVTTMRACFHPDQNRRTTRKPASRVTKPIRSGRNLLGFWVPNGN
jgi:hypothetical protein